MSTIEKDVSTVDTLGNHAETAQERVLELRRWREQIPNFVIPETPKATSRLNNVVSVSAAFIELTNVAVANQTALAQKAAERAAKAAPRAAKATAAPKVPPSVPDTTSEQAS